MGIPALWKLLGDGEVISMADLASDHFERTGQPFRVAIDEAGWRFKNLTDAQVAAIRKTEPAANPIEKAIFWRICRLMRAHIHPVFVFDGAGRPWKRGRKGGNRVDYERTRLLERLLTYMRIPYHRAPGEAEAECARMQQAGTVDAVWSDDADSLMFGASVLIKDHRDPKGKTAKHEDLVQVYRIADIERKHGLNAQAIVAYAVLLGGDYDMKGLLNCGETTVNLMARKRLLQGLGRTLCSAQSERELFKFRQELDQALAEVRVRLPIPADFPRWLAVKHYKNPKVSANEQIVNLRFRLTWDKPVNHDKLRELLRDRFNIWTKGYLKYIGPILLLRELSSTVPGEEAKNDPCNISILKRRKRGGIMEDGVPKDIKIMYRPSALTPSTILTQPEEEDWQLLGTKEGPFDPSDAMELETLRCLVVRGKGRATFDAELAALSTLSSGSSRKRKAPVDEAEARTGECEPKAKKARKPSKPPRVPSEESVERGKQRRTKQREQYNASKSQAAITTVPISSANRPTAHAMSGAHTSAPRSTPSMPIDLTASDNGDDNDLDIASLPTAGFRPPPSLSRRPTALTNNRHTCEPANVCPRVSVVQPISDDPLLAGLNMAEHNAFKADTLTAIQQSLVDARMLSILTPSVAPAAAEDTLEPMPVNVHVASEAAKSLLLSPRTAVRQRWASASTSKASELKEVPTFIDLT